MKDVPILIKLFKLTSGKPFTYEDLMKLRKELGFKNQVELLKWFRTKPLESFMTRMNNGIDGFYYEWHCSPALMAKFIKKNVPNKDREKWKKGIKPPITMRSRELLIGQLKKFRSINHQVRENKSQIATLKKLLAEAQRKGKALEKEVKNFKIPLNLLEYLYHEIN